RRYRTAIMRLGASTPVIAHVGGFPDTAITAQARRNVSMTTMRGHTAISAAQRSDRANALLESLAAQDFDQLGGAFTAGARLRALLPSGPREWAGANIIARQFAHWFGDTAAFQVIDARVGDVGGRLHLQWRLRLRAERLGAGWFTVEQQAYADAG